MMTFWAGTIIRAAKRLSRQSNIIEGLKNDIHESSISHPFLHERKLRMKMLSKQKNELNTHVVIALKSMEYLRMRNSPVKILCDLLETPLA